MLSSDFSRQVGMDFMQYRETSVMNILKRGARCLVAFIFFSVSFHLHAQVVVDGKDISGDKSITYIQFLYYIEKSTFRPVYLIDHGLVDNQQATPKKQKVSIDKTEIRDTMSPIYVLNLLARSGWEYMGDETYVQVPMMEGWYSFTLRRKK